MISTLLEAVKQGAPRSQLVLLRNLWVPHTLPSEHTADTLKKSSWRRFQQFSCFYLNFKVRMAHNRFSKFHDFQRPLNPSNKLPSVAVIPENRDGVSFPESLLLGDATFWFDNNIFHLPSNGIMILPGANFMVATEDTHFLFPTDLEKNLPPVHCAVSKSEIRLSEIKSMPVCWQIGHYLWKERELILQMRRYSTSVLLWAKFLINAASVSSGDIRARIVWIISKANKESSNKTHTLDSSCRWQNVLSVGLE